MSLALFIGSSYSRRNTNPLSSWEDCLAHTVKAASGIRITVAVIFGKYHLPDLPYRRLAYLSARSQFINFLEQPQSLRPVSVLLVWHHAYCGVSIQGLNIYWICMGNIENLSSSLRFPPNLYRI
jgi:hypothetical protein